MDRLRGFERISLKQWRKDAQRSDESYMADIMLPLRGTALSAGYDLFSTIDVFLRPNQEVLVPLGIKIYMREDEFFEIHPRSGIGFKYYIRLANTTGIIDSDYYNNSENEGHCWAKLRNESVRSIVHIKIGMGIAQGIFQKFLLADGDFLGGNKRTGGFGSTTRNKY